MSSKTAEAPAKSPAAVRNEAGKEAQGGAPSFSLDDLIQDAAAKSGLTPSMSPPDDTAVASDSEGITAWHNGKKITAMWCNAANRNAYAAVSGLGWRKLSNANDSAFLSMVMLASHAETVSANVNINIGSDNEIHEIYVW